MKVKVSKHKLNIHYWSSPWGSRTQQHAYCLRYADSQHIESHLSRKQLQAKLPIAFPFSQLHFNKCYFSYSYLRRPSCYGQLEMRSAKPGNHVKLTFPFFCVNYSTYWCFTTCFCTLKETKVGSHQFSQN